MVARTTRLAGPAPGRCTGRGRAGGVRRGGSGDGPPAAMTPADRDLLLGLPWTPSTRTRGERADVGELDRFSAVVRDLVVRFARNGGT
ncbi:hypothetical protein BN6_37550 [Saccharothrix espanaensis DSM 44229]|uniref:Uncharacterized protein n=2 Tax=Saccharothrix espanaensis TaxID=103731 RepID=K0JY28_SACES|nr:hypothetical protein BN6_37550 [Saccharothrix espanaensis DSM 44229]